MNLTSHDAQLQQAAFRHLNRLADLRCGSLDSADLAGGVEFGGERIPSSTGNAASSSLGK
jgi:hypothetical protein